MPTTRSRCHLTILHAESSKHLAHTWAYDAETLREQAAQVRNTYPEAKLRVLLRLPTGRIEELP